MFAFKLVVLLARGVIFEIYTIKLTRHSCGAPKGAVGLHLERASAQADLNNTLKRRTHAKRCCGHTHAFNLL
jgi:hypothetical protein